MKTKDDTSSDDNNDRDVDRRTSLIQIPSFDEDKDNKYKEFFETRRGVRNAVKSIRISQRKFDVTTLPDDLFRVYNKLKSNHDEQYALIFVFIVRTGVELHRAWHLTLLTNKILQRIKQKFKIRCTWSIGVTKLIFRVDDGGFELHRKAPYDYDSEYQDLYMRLSEALIEGHISIHEALIYQTGIKKGLHTAPACKFFRKYPGRLVLHSFEAATCAVIFFDGDWADAGVAAICGFAAGSIQWALSAVSNSFGSSEVTVLVDVLASGVTGIIGGLFFRFVDYPFCLSAVFAGTLYWFFYGTAFVVGILEVIAGELETGVTRFMAVMVKTFVLSLCSAIGLMIVVDRTVYDTWIIASNDDTHCGTINLDQVWWRIPLYLLCSASALGQYRMPLADYWRGLIVQLVGYEVQYQVITLSSPKHPMDFLDTAAANVAGAMAALISASIVRGFVDHVGDIYITKLLKTDPPDSFHANFLYRCRVFRIRFCYWLGLGRKSDIEQLGLQSKLQQKRKELNDPNHPRHVITLSRDSEHALIEAVVESQGINLWALLMPAVYQLVPGRLMAQFWYNVIFPPPLSYDEQVDQVTGAVFIDKYESPQEIETTYGLWVVSLSLALGLILGNTAVSAFHLVWNSVWYQREGVALSKSERQSIRRRDKFQQQGIMESGAEGENDPDDPDDGGGKTNKKTDEPITVEDDDSRIGRNGKTGAWAEKDKKDGARKEEPRTDIDIPSEDLSIGV